MVRTALLWQVQGEALVGTLHAPPRSATGERANPVPAAVLLLNPGPAPRSGNGDLSARLGDRLTLSGMLVFRFDFSGLGDSSGSTPLALGAYWNAVVAGRNDLATTELIHRIRLEFGVDRVLVGGLCAATLPSLRSVGSASAAPSGLILLEPDLRWGLELTSGGLPPHAPSPPTQVRARLLHRIRTAVENHRDSPLARTLRSSYALLRRFCDQWPWPRMPSDANTPLVACWQAGLARGIPSLLVVAAGRKNDRYVTRILAAMPAALASGVACVRVPDTNHLLTSGRGREAVLEAVENWVIAQCGGTTGRATASPSGERDVAWSAAVIGSGTDMRERAYS